tara:strand:- start:241 stop:1434 length:1194 start_codon:yes stop_codon:yes gene_type:complete
MLEVALTGIVAGGKAMGRAPDGRVVFVSYAIPGEQVVAEVTETHTQYFEARTVRVLRPSSFRVKPRCQYFGRCGGCQLQHVEYDEQLRIKTQIVRDQLIRVGRFSDDHELTFPPAIGMEMPWNYRNHMRFTVWRKGQVGLMQQGTHQLLRVDQCDIACDQINQALGMVQDATTGTKQLVMRVGQNTGDVLIHPRLAWRDNATNPSLESGQKIVRETLLGRRYQISVAAFFQVNTIQAERLLGYVIDKVNEVSPRVVVDAYAGVGVFASHLAAHVSEVFAIEESPSAATDAGVNLMGLSNVEWMIARVEDVLPRRDFSPDVVIVDPPRRGLPPEVLGSLVASPAYRIIYVSCDPATLARDLRRLVNCGFKLTEVQLLDMFPHTQHIECVAIVDRVFTL